MYLNTVSELGIGTMRVCDMLKVKLQSKVPFALLLHTMRLLQNICHEQVPAGHMVRMPTSQQHVGTDDDCICITVNLSHRRIQMVLTSNFSQEAGLVY